jgi:serine protease
VSSRLLARLTVLAALTLGLTAAGGGTSGAGVDRTGASPTSSGRAVVAFTPAALPAVAPGATLAGLGVVDVSASGAFVVVRADDLGPVRAAVAGLPGVRFVEDDPVKFALATPNDSRYGEQYGPAMMGAHAAWDVAGYGSSAVKVAVLDTGIRRTHQDFTPASRFLTGRDYVDDDNDPNDRCGHGTHVIGTVGASTNNSLGVAGMSQASILPMKVLDLVGGLLGVTCTGNGSDIATAIRAAADQGAKVISMSLGGGGSTVEKEAVTYAWSKGSLIVAAAGNDGGNNSVDYPAAYPESIAVGALTSSKTRASYSDGGPQLDIAAPGSNVLSTYSSNDASYSSLSGTSMATPHVAGALALALGCAPAGTTNVAARDALYATAEDLGASGRDDIYGHGLARVDRLVQRLCGSTPPPPPPGNSAPTAAFTTTTSGLTVSADGRSSSDPDGDALTYSWAWGDGTTSTGATASRTYAAAGTYSVTLTVDDGRGGSDTETRSVTVSAPSDPDPGAPTIASGQAVSFSITAGEEKFWKISVPSGAGQLQVVLDGPACGVLSCSVDADLYTRHNARPTATTYACRPYASGSDETCTHTAPASGYWYIRVYGYSGSGSLTLRATLT